MDKILFLDFDGVLFDTLREVYLVNRYVYNKTELLSDIDKKNYELFGKYKYLVYNIWMFYYYNPLIFENISQNEIPIKFNLALENRNLIKEKEFYEDFIKARNNLISNHYDFWKNLEVPYEFFYKIKEMNVAKVVVSKKNKKSIIERFSAYDFNLDTNLIFDWEALENYSSKADFMAEYMSKNGFKEAVFVDDNLNNIKPCEKYPQIKALLALWGNSEPKAKGYSQQEALKEIEKLFA